MRVLGNDFAIPSIFRLAVITIREWLVLFALNESFFQIADRKNLSSTLGFRRTGHIHSPTTCWS